MPSSPENPNLNRKDRLVRWGVPIAGAAAIAGGAFGFAKKAGASVKTGAPEVAPLIHRAGNPAGAEHPDAAAHEADNPWTHLTKFMHELNNGKIPVRSLGAIVTFRAQTKESLHPILYAPNPRNSWVAGKRTPFAGFGMGIATFEGNTYLYGCDVSELMFDDKSLETEQEAMKGCASPDVTTKAAYIFINLDNPPPDLKILYKKGTAYDGKVHGAHITGKFNQDKTFVTPGVPTSFQVNAYDTPATLTALAKEMHELPVSSLKDLK